MKINLTQHVHSSKINPKGEMWYSLHLYYYIDYDVVKSVLVKKLNVTLVEELEWVWLRRGIFEKDGNKFILYWDDDFGIFLLSADHTEKESEWLEKIIQEAIPLIEKVYNREIKAN